MGKTFSELDEALCGWIGRQPLFFVATAPNDPDGHINLSPKGGKGTFRVLGPRTVAYLDLLGSGIETAAHLRENGRIVVTFCAFEGPPRIVRLHGRGRVVQQHEPAFAGLVARFQPSADILTVLRSVIMIDVTRIGDSCGYMVPRMDYVEERQQLFRWADKLGDNKDAYIRTNNASSIDALPGLSVAAPATEAEVRALSAEGRKI
jgi:hypothetical protein